ncbi:glyoxylate/hydroxypyruvate reductase A [Balneolaceae bacterium YR4-1]|uniref:Glyoxylate/hydroxypyruvate reductase A n=1 Tax=Halalkalibaculum roseum TaxID=2709311 RepID=A0A6M1SLD3_9BACT|nr:glyoxylate/hydroxypyruvate reductase A [Halalkalibaculum roseum]NGP75809.1 glyoxylate/hydroxypyruvate reductase A [Halalkalibaculum roseum]
MSLVLLAPDRNMQPWKEALLNIDPNLDVEIWPGVSNSEKVQYVVAWNQPKQVLNSYPNLKAVSSLGAGADHLLKDDSLPEDIPICRVVSPSLVSQMKEYVLNAVLNYQRNTHMYAMQKVKGIWEPHPNKSPEEFTIGIMGLGELGRPTATYLAQLEYRVSGWSKSVKNIENVETYSGKEELESFLTGCCLLICMLPLTEETEGILDLDTFKKLKRPGYLINVARGEHLVEEDLIYALDKEWMEGALLDVFSKEPLPESHAFWNREKIMITPHVSSLTPPEEVAPQIVDNYKRALSGMDLKHKVDREKGY